MAKFSKEDKLAAVQCYLEGKEAILFQLTQKSVTGHVLQLIMAKHFEV